MNRQQFLRTLALGGLGLLAAPLLPKPSAPPGEGWVYVGDIIGGGAQTHTHDGPTADGSVWNHRHIGIDFVEVGEVEP